MGKITNFLKGGATDMVNQVKSIDVSSQINSAISSTNLTSFKMPDIDTSELTKNIKFGTKLSDVKLPGGMTNYISPVVTKMFGNVKLPSEIGGISLPKLPDLSSVIPEVESFLSGIGFDTKALGIRSISDILKEPDLSSLKNVQFDSRIDMNNLPDMSKALDGFNIDSLQSDIDTLTSSIPEMKDIDISKYF